METLLIITKSMANMKIKTKEITVMKMQMINTIVNSNQTNMRSTTYRDATKIDKLQIIVIITELRIMRNKNTITLTMMTLTKIMTKN